MNIKKASSLLVAFSLALTLALPISASGGALPVDVPANANITLPTFDVPCRNALLISADTGEVLYEKAPDAEVSIASITKVMTLLLTFEAIDSGKVSLSDKVPTSVHAYEMGGSQIWLEPGEEFTLDEMLKAICVSSANDAAVAVAEFIGGSEPVFAEMMNRRAAELGMTHTHFINACGLDEPGHYSSARDVALMSRELLKHKDVLKYTNIWMDSLRGGSTQLVNTNKLLKSYSGITGLKTGTTGQAGRCISATAEREGMGLVAVVLGGVTSEERFTAAMEMLDYGFANYEAVAFPPVAGAATSLPVALGAEKEVALVYHTPEKVLAKKGSGASLCATLTLPQKLSAPVQSGVEVGAVTLKSGETVIASYPIVTAKSVDKMDFNTGIKLLFDALTAL